MPRLSRLVKTAAIMRTVLWTTGFFLHDRRHDQGFVGQIVGQIRSPLLPGGAEAGLHRLVGARENLKIAGPGVEMIGIGEEQSFRMPLGHLQPREHLAGGQAGGIVPDARMGIQRRSHLGEGPALDEYDFRLGDFAPGQFAEERQGGNAFGQLVHAGSNRAGLAEETTEEHERVTFIENSLVHQPAGDSRES